jgi:hypothetical protein
MNRIFMRAIVYQSLAAAIAFSGLYLSCMNPGGTEVENEKTISVYLADGKTPAVGAKIAIYHSSDTTHIPVYTATTDSKGRYAVDSIQFQNGYYNINSRLDKLAAMQDSVFILSNNTSSISDDTLFDTRTLSGFAALQPNNNVQTVTVHVLGTNTKVNVNDKGVFTIEELALGKYTLMLVSTLSEYTPLYYRITVSPTSSDTLHDTLRLPYTGIPIVAGLSASYDTLQGVVTVFWNKTSYFDFQRYNIYRTDASSIAWPSDPQYITQDTAIHDTLVFPMDTVRIDSFDLQITPVAATQSKKYRVTVVDNSDREGLPYKYVQVDAINPYYATKVTAYGEKVHLPQNGLCTLRVTPGPWYGTVTKVEWDIGKTGTFTSSTALDTILSFPANSIITGLPCVVRITGINNRTGSDTFALSTIVSPKLIGRLPFKNDSMEQVLGLTSAIFKDRVYVFYRNMSKWTTGVMSSRDGVAWEIDNDNIGSDSIRTPAVFNGRLFVLSRSQAGFLLVSENGKDYAKVTISDSFDNDTISSFRYGFLSTDGKKLYCATPKGIWAMDTVGSWEKIAANIPIELFKEYLKPFTFKGNIYLFTEDPFRYPNSLITIYRTDDYMSYTETSSLAGKNENWGPGMPLLVSDSMVILFQNDQQKITCSADMSTWYEVGRFTQLFVDAIRFNNRNMIFTSNGSIYTIE